MKMIHHPLLLALAMFLTAAGCGQKEAAKANELEKVFQPARNTAALPADSQAAQVNSLAAEAVAAIKTNDSATAVVVLDALRNQPNLTPDQRLTVQEQMGNIQSRLAERADRGDPAAIKALEMIRQGKRRR